MAKRVKLKNDMYLDTRGIVHNKELLSNVLDKTIRFKLFHINFDISNVNIGDWVIGYTENTIPRIDGMRVVGFLTYGISFGDVNFVLSPQSRENKVVAKMLLKFKGNVKEINLQGYIVYAKPSIVDNTPI